MTHYSQYSNIVHAITIPSEFTDGNNYGRYIWDESTNVLITEKVYQLRDIIQNTPGSELITVSDDRDFTSDTAFWAKDAGVTISGGKLNYTSCASGKRLYRNGLIAARQVIRVQFDIDSITGSLQTGLGGQLWDIQSAAGQYLHDFAVSTANTRFQISSTGASTDAVCDNVSLKKILGNHLIEIVYPPTKESLYITWDGVNDYSRTAVGAASIGTIYIVGQRIGTDEDFDVFNALTGFGEYSTNTLTIGALYDLSVYYNIRIKEILIRSVTDNAAIITKVNNFLKFKYGITTIIPIDLSQLSAFSSLYQTPTKDVTIVHVGDSISVNLGMTSVRVDASSRPPMMTELNTPSWIEDYLRWSGQIYRRYDYAGVFTETGAAATKSADAYWGWQAPWTALNVYYPLSRCLTGLNASVSYKFPANMVRCDFIIHTDSQWTASTDIAITEGDGVIEVWNGAAWVEANGYSFSAQESAVPIDTTDPVGTILRSQYQKRIKMRTSTATEKTVTITLDGTGRLSYWGIQYSPNTYFFDYIANCHGSHGIDRLKYFQDWDIDAFNPDLIVFQCPIINEGCQTGVNPAYPCGVTPPDFATKFGDYYDYLVAKGYTILNYVLWVGLQAGIVDPVTGVLGVGNIPAYGDIIIQDYIDYLEDMHATKGAAFINVFNNYLALAYVQAISEGTNNIHISTIQASDIYGTTYNKDGIHPNDRGVDIAWEYLKPYFKGIKT